MPRRKKNTKPSVENKDVASPDTNTVEELRVEVSAKGTDASMLEINKAADHLQSVLNHREHDPLEAFRSIQEARDQLSMAVQRRDEVMASASDEQQITEETGKVSEEEFRGMYMEMMTTAFASELDDIRTGKAAVLATSKKRKKKSAAANAMDEDNVFVAPPEQEADAEAAKRQAEDIDVDVLVNILQSGARAFSKEEKAILAEERERANRRSDDDGGSTDAMTPHERRRRLVGL